MTADQARELADKHTKSKIDFTINDVYRIIEEKCKAGLVQVFLEGEIGQQIFQQLIVDGFEVNKVFRPIRPYENNRCRKGYLVIWSASK